MQQEKNFGFEIFEFTNHALIRTGERGITIAEIKNSIEYGEQIAAYPNDKPYPSFLNLHFLNEEPIHVCFAITETNSCRVITVYKPDLSIFEDDFKTKRKL